jgi:Tol biopolymer transport system component
LLFSDQAGAQPSNKEHHSNFFSFSNQIALIPHKQSSPGQIQRISIGVNGDESNRWSGSPSVSDDGRYIAFSSEATNLVPDDTNGYEDIFLYDRQTGELIRVSVANDKTEADSSSNFPAISGNGRYVVFQSEAGNLVADDTNRTQDIFVYDQIDDTIRRVSVKADGSEARGSGKVPTISADGRFIAFEFFGALVSDDTNEASDIYLADQLTGEIRRVSMAPQGAEANGFSSFPSVSATGQFVAFSSNANNLAANDRNGIEDVFVVDVQTGETERVSIASDGTAANGESFRAVISGDGRYVAFMSRANNLVPTDVNFTSDAFVHDRETGQTIRVSDLPEDARLAPEEIRSSSFPAISADGRFVTFYRYPTFSSLNFPYGYFLYDLITSQVTHIASSFDDKVGNGPAALSADGRYIAFGSDDDTLVLDDTNHEVDIFVLEYPVSALPTPEPTATATPTPTISTPTPTETPDNTVTATASSSPTPENTVETAPGVEGTTVVEESVAITPTPSQSDSVEERNDTLLVITIGFLVLIVLIATWMRFRSHSSL